MHQVPAFFFAKGIPVGLLGAPPIYGEKTDISMSGNVAKQAALNPLFLFFHFRFEVFLVILCTRVNVLIGELGPYLDSQIMQLRFHNR